MSNGDFPYDRRTLGNLGDYNAGLNGGQWNGYGQPFQPQLQQPQFQQLQPFQSQIAQFLQGVTMFDGNKPIVVCGGEVKEAKDMDAAQALAETLAHSKSADAFILKPVRKVSPKRDVVSTDLP